MYESFFGLREPAFALTPDPRFLWGSETHQEALAALHYGIAREKGFLLLSGEVGTGKTTVLRAVLDRLAAEADDPPEVAMVMNTVGIGAADLLKLVAAEFRLTARVQELASGAPSAADFVIAIQQYLLTRFRAKARTVLVIDEAQNLGFEALEQVRLLSNLETNQSKVLQIVLTGQPELRKQLADPRLRQLRQRIAVAHQVAPLKPEEVRAYLRHRIRVAGGRYEDVFFYGCDSIFNHFSRGYPRLINLLADNAMLAAFSKGIRPVVPALLERKAKELALASTGRDTLEPRD